MSISGFVFSQALPDRTPDRACWLLFRAGSYERLRALQQGKMYMNSVEFFSNMAGEPSSGLRGDVLEKNYFKFHAANNGEIISELKLEIGSESIDLGENAILRIDLPSPSQIFIFCMAALADGPDGRIPGERAGEVQLSKRFFEFGDHALIIRSNPEFGRRVSAAIASNPFLYTSDFFEGGHGQIDYVHLASHYGVVGLFRKDIEYAWQREYRVCIGAEHQALNASGALELNIGDISDISEIVPLSVFLNGPIKLRRGQIDPVTGKHQYID